MNINVGTSMSNIEICGKIKVQNNLKQNCIGLFLQCTAEVQGNADDTVIIMRK